MGKQQGNFTHASTHCTKDAKTFLCELGFNPFCITTAPISQQSFGHILG